MRNVIFILNPNKIRSGEQIECFFCQLKTCEKESRQVPAGILERAKKPGSAQQPCLRRQAREAGGDVIVYVKWDVFHIRGYCGYRREGVERGHRSVIFRVAILGACIVTSGLWPPGSAREFSCVNQSREQNDNEEHTSTM